MGLTGDGHVNDAGRGNQGWKDENDDNGTGRLNWKGKGEEEDGQRMDQGSRDWLAGQ
jgi:hypothetical protein